MLRKNTRLACALVILVASAGRVCPANANGALTRALTSGEVVEIGRLLGLSGTATEAELMRVLSERSVLGRPQVRSVLGRRTPSERQLLRMMLDEPELATAIRGVVVPRPRSPSRLGSDCAPGLEPLIAQIDDAAREAANVAAKQQQAYDIVRGVMQRGYPGITGDWLSAGRSELETQKLVEYATRLTPGQRTELLELLEESPPADDQVQFVFELALYDDRMWSVYLDRLARSGSEPGLADDALVPLFQNMPASLRTNLHAKLPRLYANAPKARTPGRNGLGGKRVLDLFLRYTWEPDRRFLELVDSGSTPRRALDEVVRETQRLVFGEQRELTYGADELLAGAREIQDEIISFEQRTGRKAHAWVVGSLPNGKGHSGSDWDVRSSDAFLADVFAQKENSEALLGLGEHGPGLPYQCCGLPISQSTAKNPLTLRITSDTIAVDVFAPLTPQTESVMRSQRIEPKPRTFVIETRHAKP